MSGEVNENQYVSYPMFKGLQKPLEFMGFQGRYITWAASAVGGAILGFIIAYCILGFVLVLWFLLFPSVREQPSSSSNRRKGCIPRRKSMVCSSMLVRIECNQTKFKRKQMSKCVEI